MQITLYSLELKSDSTLAFHSHASSKAVFQASKTWILCSPPLTIYKVCWNKNVGKEMELASGGRFGFVRLDTVF